jgi:hypothetical protein
MAQDELPPRQEDPFATRRIADRDAKTLATIDDDLAVDPDLDELVDTLIEAPEFAEAHQITEALGIDPDTAPRVEPAGDNSVASDRPAPQGQLRDVEDAVKAVDYDIADLLARASEELEQRQVSRADEDRSMGDSVTSSADRAGVPDGFTASGFEPDSARLESFNAAARPPAAGGPPHLAVVRGAVADSDVGSVNGRDRKVTLVAAPDAEPGAAPSSHPDVKPERSRPKEEVSAKVARLPERGASKHDIDELWQETSRLERRFAAAQDLRDSLGRATPAPSELPLGSVPFSSHPRFEEMHGDGGSRQWRRRLLSWLAAGLVAAAIITAGRLGLFDPARTWLHQQLGWSSAAANQNGAQSAPLSPQPVRPADSR